MAFAALLLVAAGACATRLSLQLLSSPHEAREATREGALEIIEAEAEAEAEVGDAFCCFFGTDADDVCGTCRADGIAKADHSCGRTRDGCHACAGHWCAPGAGSAERHGERRHAQADNVPLFADDTEDGGITWMQQAEQDRSELRIKHLSDDLARRQAALEKAAAELRAKKAAEKAKLAKLAAKYDGPAWRRFPATTTATTTSTTTTVLTQAAAPKVNALFCFALVMPFGYEPGLLQAQRKKGAGIFGCDDHLIFSNSTTNLENGTALPFPVTVVNVSLAVAYGGMWHTALNTGIFNKVWKRVIGLELFRRNDWVVKADPDTVFFPQRMRALLDKRAPLGPGAGPRVAKPCGGMCQLKSYAADTCQKHVDYLMSAGQSCPTALQIVGRKPPLDCGCACKAEDVCAPYSNEAVYINNCRFGLHGPIEVFSRAAMQRYVTDGLQLCQDRLAMPWGEDYYVDQCLMRLGIARVDEFEVLNEIACHETPGDCDGADVAFHPFKSIPTYFKCWHNARARFEDHPDEKESKTWVDVLLTSGDDS